MVSNNNYYLYTTAIKSSKYSLENNILLLGKWCINPFSIDKLELLKNKLIKHRWENKNLHSEDFKKIEQLYEKYLKIISEKLNSFHNVNENLNYWRILIGPWLMYMCIILYERFYVLEDAFNNNIIDNCLKFKKECNLKVFVANDMEDFNKIIENDFWNLHIYSIIIDFILPENKFDEIDEPTKIYFNLNKKSIKSWIYNFIFKISNFITTIFFSTIIKKNKFVYLGTYLGLKNLIILYFKTKEFPIFDKINKPKLGEINNQMRKNLFLINNNNNIFEDFFSAKVLQYIPVVFFEDFKSLKQQANTLVLPNLPKVIFTSNLLYHKTLFMMYVAEKTKIGSKLIIAQHGGAYFTSKYHRSESHEIKISDKYLSWGSSTDNIKVLNTGIIKNVKKLKSNKQANKIFLILNSIPRYVCNLSADSITINFDVYINDCINIYRVINSKLTKSTNFYLRPYFYDYGWNERQIFKDNFSNILFEETSKNIWNIASQSKLVIFSYNSTGFLELIASKKVPVMIFFNLEVDQIREDVIPFFHELEEVGIFHKDIKSLDIHLSKIIDNIDDWWQSKEVQNTLHTFSSNFAINNLNLINDIIKVIKCF